MGDLSLAELSEQVRGALESADLAAYRDLLAPDATWGPPDDEESGCHNRDEVLEWYRRARAAGVSATVTEVVAGAGKLLVGSAGLGAGWGRGWSGALAGADGSGGEGGGHPGLRQPCDRGRASRRDRAR
jgi:hypothetical protein